VALREDAAIVVWGQTFVATKKQGEDTRPSARVFSHHLSGGRLFSMRQTSFSVCTRKCDIVKAMKYSKHPRVVDATVGDDTVLMNVDQLDYFSMNPVASRIWEILGEGDRTREEICDILLDEYDVDRQQCEESLDSFLKEGIQREFIVAT
jgi:hypothetical protein